MSVVIQCYTTDHRVIQPHYGLYLVLYSSSLYQPANQGGISGQQNGKLSTETMSPNSYSQKNNNELLFAHQPQFNKGKKVCVFIRAAKQRFAKISQSQRWPLLWPSPPTNLLIHYAKWVPKQVDNKLGRRRKDHKGLEVEV